MYVSLLPMTSVDTDWLAGVLFGEGGGGAVTSGGNCITDGLARLRIMFSSHSLVCLEDFSRVFTHLARKQNGNVDEKGKLNKSRYPR